MQEDVSLKAYSTLQQPSQHTTLASIHPHGLLSKHTSTERHLYCNVQRNEEGGQRERKMIIAW